MVATAPQAGASARVGKFSIASGRRPAPGRFVIFGVGSVGKTTLAGGAPRPLFLSAEAGDDELDVDRIVFDDQTGRVQPRTFDEVIDAVSAVAAGDGPHQTLVVDGAGAIDALIQEHVVRKNPKWSTIQTPGFGQGEAAVLDVWRSFVARLEDVRVRRRMRVILIGHSQIAKFKNPEGAEFDRYQLAVTTHPKGDVAGFLFGWADLVGFYRFETLTAMEGKRAIGIGEGARILHLQRSNAFDAKCRYRGLPSSIQVPAERPWAALQKAIDDGGQPSQLRAEVARLMADVDETTRAKVEGWLATVGDNTAALAEGIDKLRSKLRMDGATSAGGDA